MRFLGIDLGWHGKPTGLAALDLSARWLTLAATGRLSKTDEILDWIGEQARDGPAMAAVDAPTIIGNPAGMREADRLTHRLFGRHHAGAYPANLKRPYARRTVKFGIALERMGFAHADRIDRRLPGRYQIEVYPHAAIVQLFALGRIIKYKKGRLAERRKELGRYREVMLRALPGLSPPLRLGALPTPPADGAGLKEAEDKLDAVMCAYIGAHWWFWGTRRNLVLGSRDRGGYIVVPRQPPGLMGRKN